MATVDWLLHVLTGKVRLKIELDYCENTANVENTLAKTTNGEVEVHLQQLVLLTDFHMRTTGFMMAVSAGLCAASASVVAKFAFSSSEVIQLCTFLLQYIPNVDPTDTCLLVTPVLRILCFLLMLGFNGVMWTMYVKSMQSIGTMRATLTNTSSNLLSTAFLGWLVFSEAQSIRWFFGATLIMTGLLFMHRGSRDQSPKKNR